MADILQEFLSGSQEGLDQLDLDLISLVQNPDDTDRLANVYRIVHTIKGTSALLGFNTLEKLTHSGESLLERYGRRRDALDDSMTGLLLEMVGAIRAQLDLIGRTGSDGGDYDGLILRIDDAAAMGARGKPGIATADSLVQVVAAAGKDEVEEKPRDVAEETDDGELSEAPQMAELDEEMQEVLKDFLQESFENLDRVDGELIELEEQPDNREMLSSIFRSLHTIKGTCGFFGFEKLERVTHAGENLLVKLRDGNYSMTEDIATGLLAMVDAVRAMLVEITDKGHDGRKTYRQLIDCLGELNDFGELRHIKGFLGGAPAKSKDLAGDGITPDRGTADSTETPTGDVAVVNELEPAGSSGCAAVMAPVPPSAVATEAAGQGSTAVVEPSIRVDVPVLDSLMNLVGELVLARNQIVEYVGNHENTQVVAATQRLNLITSELQEGVMQTRMQPIHSVWAKLPRVVRDLSRACGKQIRVEMQGKATELDKSLIEAMKDPITHLVRNSVDHGIELPEQRVAAGKPAEGVLLLRAFHEGGQVHIEISDDGAGIKAERIKKKAIENGVVTEEQASGMSDQEICKLIFLPGFSTAEEVTNISGRGVGMDVVKTNIETISGTIDLDTEVGSGTVIKIRVPLTLAIVPALIVSSGMQRFAIPQVNLIELIRVDEDDQSSAIEFIHDCPVYRLRGQLLPLVYLNKELRLDSTKSSALNVVVLQAEKCRFGLVVDQINDTQEIVVKPLAEALKSIPVFAGATIMGDGRVALILDPLGIGQRARVTSESHDEPVTTSVNEEAANIGQSQALLLVTTAADGKVAIPLASVARLEQFDVSRTESAGDSIVVQYRGQIMPLVELSDFLAERRAGYEQAEQSEAPIQVVVFGDEGRQVGLIVKEIVDVADEVLETRGKAGRAGVTATAAIRGRVTELFDVSLFLATTSSMINELEELA